MMMNVNKHYDNGDDESMCICASMWYIWNK